ncbi:putative Peroxiredoxin Q, chloroplastic [Blattamonas nauphoetae]|uniref:thioredoxin-dependent peroxiredoxin n=1 Tax=Blattamonas nauphoetae TaxID=2049346 RepID=A0ABQ9XHV1_9EUKA|nr:putative Peroxiredoxin Q, chloroplastic [Blattamonas nauphoetae]
MLFQAFILLRTVFSLEIGEIPPDFTLIDQDANSITFSSLIGTGPIVVFFYHKDSKKWDQRELKGFKSYTARFQKKNATVLGISGDALTDHASISSKLGLKYSLLTDKNYSVKSAWGIPRFMLHKTARMTFVFNTNGELEYSYKSELWPWTHALKAYNAVKALKAGEHIWKVEEEEEHEGDHSVFVQLMEDMMEEAEQMTGDEEPYPAYVDYDIIEKQDEEEADTEELLKLLNTLVKHMQSK